MGVQKPGPRNLQSGLPLQRNATVAKASGSRATMSDKVHVHQVPAMPTAPLPQTPFPAHDRALSAAIAFAAQPVRTRARSTLRSRHACRTVAMLVLDMSVFRASRRATASSISAMVHQPGAGPRPAIAAISDAWSSGSRPTCLPCSATPERALEAALTLVAPSMP